MRAAWLVVATACGRVGFDARRSGVTDGDGSIAGDIATNSDVASGSGPPACGATQLFSESWTGGAGQWMQVNSGGFTIAIGGGHLAFTFPPTSGFGNAELTSVAVLDAREACFVFELDGVPSSGQPASGYMLLSNALGQVSWEWLSGELAANWTSGIIATAPYTGAQAAKLQLQIHAGAVYWSYAVGAAPLTVLTSLGSTPIDFSQITIDVGADTNAMTSSNAGTVTFGSVVAHGP